MAKLGRPANGGRPEGYEEACRKVLDNEMSLKDASKTLDVTYSWFCKLFWRDHPGFRPKTDWQRKTAVEVGSSRRKYVSWLEANINDRDLCQFIREKGRCSECPRKCVSNRMTKGLGKLISETRVTLKGAEKDLEGT